MAEELEEIDLSLEDRHRVSALPWRGQFSPLTVERLLRALSCEGTTVLDPFVGSGTSLLEAARLGYPSVGLDINPAAVALAECAALAALEPVEREAALSEAIRKAFAASASASLTKKGIDVSHALALLAHMEGSPAAATRRVEALIESLPPSPIRTEVLLGDARATGLPDASAGIVLTSPPYINVFNYHQYGRPVSDSFGWPILLAARSEIGSNRQNRVNRFRTVVQFSIDMALVLAEVARVLVPGSTAVFVLGRESNVRGVPFFNGDIFARLAVALGAFDRHERAERRFTSRFGKNIYEDVLVLKQSRSRAWAPGELERVGREIGLQVLRGCQPTEATAAEVFAAIEAGPNISASPVSPPT